MRGSSLFRVALAIAALIAADARAQFAFDYEPTQREVILNTNLTTIQPKNGPPYQVRGGVFTFRNVRIRQGVTVRGVGSNPMIWIVSGSFVVEGHLSVDGGDGDSVNTIGSANMPTPGGAGGANGGFGGLGSPSSVARSFSGEPGFGPFQIPGFGGQGGLLSCLFNDTRAGGGGGGAFATLGDPNYAVKSPQQSGFGGAITLKAPPAPPGTMLFRDRRQDNDFWGVGFDVATRRFVVGELPIPVGGQGGGGGGDHPQNCLGGFMSDEKGGGGGGGGGALILYSLGSISIAATGRITADGGNGGGGAWAGGNNLGGGGGGGSGGMVVLAARQTIDIEVHGETYANQDYDFALSADGGIGTASGFGGAAFLQKYPPNPGVRPVTTGGFGGMGIVQLFTPPGPNADNTNTALDDNVRLFRNQTQLAGAEKIRYLAWRGFQNGNGVFVDDSGKPTNIGANEGDIRPSPVLLPLQ